MHPFPYIAELFVIGGIASAAVIAVDTRSCRQPMRIMNSVWILTGLWASFFGLWAYYAFGRARRCTLDEKAESERLPEVSGTDRSARNGAGAAEAEANTTSIASGINRPEEKMAGMEMPDMGRPGMEMPGMSEMEMPATSAAGMDMSAKPASGMAGMKISGMPGMDKPATSASGMDMSAKPASGMAGMKMPGMPGMDTPATSMSGMNMPGMEMPARPKWQSTVLSTLHCGAGCTLADLTGEWFLYFVPVAIGGSLIAGSWIIDYLLALLFGIGFQYAAIRAMEPATPRAQIVRRAAKADILSLTAWQAGMYGWMAVVIFALSDGAMLPRTSFQFWFMMQIAMAFGFLVAWPVNVWLIRAGIKKGM